MLAMSALFTASPAETKYAARTIPRWDTYSDLVGIDNIYSASMSHDPDDFIYDLTKCNRVITYFGGTHHFDVFI